MMFQMIVKKQVNVQSESAENSSLDDLNIENLDINKLDEELINKMEEGRITRKDEKV